MVVRAHSLTDRTQGFGEPSFFVKKEPSGRKKLEEGETL